MGEEELIETVPEVVPEQTTEEPDEQLKILLRFKAMNVEAAMGYVADALKDANKFLR